MDELTFVRALGVQVYEVDGLEDEALWIDEERILFVRSGLSADDHRRICDEALEWIEPPVEGAVA